MHQGFMLSSMCSAVMALTCGANVTAGGAAAGAAAGAASAWLTAATGSLPAWVVTACLPPWAAAALPALSAKCWVLSGAQGSSALKFHCRGAPCPNLSACLA